MLKNIKSLYFVGLVLLILVVASPLIAAQAVSEGYSSDKVLQRGMIVRLKQDDSSKVEPVASDAADKMHGVVVNPNDAAVTLAVDGQKVFVATSGRYSLLAGTQNGKIEAGDYIAVSSIAGIGMKAGSSEQFVIGRALAGFDGSKDVISSTDVKDSAGATKTIAIGRISVDVGIAKNPLLKATEANLPSVLRKVAESVAGKQVNATRVYISILVFGITTVVAGTLLYGGVRSALISIGRNPLSKKSIIRGMLQVIITGLTVFISGVFGVYLILRL